MPPRSCWITHHEKIDLRKAARSRACTVRIPVCAITILETSVLAHYRLAGTCGTAIKPHDMQGAIACSACHDAIDGRTKRITRHDSLLLMHAEEFSEHWLSGAMRSLSDE